jgi:hypothetical protein
LVFGWDAFEDAAYRHVTIVRDYLEVSLEEMVLFSKY